MTGLTKDQREAIRDAIEHLIALLDQIEGDPDLEPDCDDEDSFDREQACEDEGAQCDDEGAADCDREEEDGV